MTENRSNNNIYVHPRENTRQLGEEKEKLAAEWLQRRGYHILEKNYRIRIGEIDLIARYQDMLIFIEVKYRRNARCGSPQAAVTPKKQRTIYRVAQHYLTVHGYSERQPSRFDVIAVYGDEITHFPDAFGGI